MNLASKIFNILNGTWKISRKIPGTGILDGIAKFVPNPNDSNELMYSENGVFYFEDGKSLDATKSYIYRYLNNDIYVYFHEKQMIKTEDVSQNLFHKFGINNTEQSPNQTKFKFKALHLCIDDKYNVTYEFDLNQPREFSITYDVKGPKKDYSSHTLFIKDNDSI